MHINTCGCGRNIQIVENVITYVNIKRRNFLQMSMLLESKASDSKTEYGGFDFIEGVYAFSHRKCLIKTFKQ